MNWHDPIIEAAKRWVEDYDHTSDAFAFYGNPIQRTFRRVKLLASLLRNGRAWIGVLLTEYYIMKSKQP